MAHLGSRTTSGDLAWDKYVYKNKNWKDLVLSLESSADFYKRKGYNLESMEVLPAGTQIKLARNSVEIIGNKKYAKSRIGRTEGYIYINLIRKPTNFKPTRHEEEVVSLINNHIAENYNMPIDIKLKGDSSIFKGISGATQITSQIKQQGGVTSDPKADIILYQDIKQPLSVKNMFIAHIYMSHKADGGPEAFQQYGGISRTSGLEIYNHPETKKFLEQVTEYIDPETGLKNPLWKNIDSSSLKNMAIYGIDFHRQYGLNHVHIIGQGLPILTPTKADNLYELDFSSHMSLSGNLSHFTGGYTPVFGATYRAGRGFEVNGKKYSGARVGIYPMQLLKNRSGAIELK